VDRWIVRPARAAAPGSALRSVNALAGFASKDVLLVIGDQDGDESLQHQLTGEGITAWSITPAPAGAGACERSAGRWEIDLADAGALDILVQRCHDAGLAIGGLVDLHSLDDNVVPLNDVDTDHVEQRLREMLAIAQALDPDLRAAGKRGAGLIANVTVVDGRFGLSKSGRISIPQTASVGFWKAAATEWRIPHLTQLDVDPALRPGLSRLVYEELRAAKNSVEIGLDCHGRWKIDMVPSPRPPVRHRPLPVDGDGVVLVTGGGRGVTADVLRLLATRTHACIVITGRTPFVDADAEPSAVRRVDDHGVRGAMLAAMRKADPNVPPAAVESAVRTVLRGRELRRVVAELARVGSEVEYHALDVRDDTALTTLVEDIYRRRGRIDGVIHAAGVVEDARIADKTFESFGRVFDTKVRPALTLTRVLRPEGLAFLCFFSSASARLGNAGQTDYGAANECLNRLATHLAGVWPTRVAAVAWGPWNGGMLQPALREAYLAHGVALLDPTDGTEAFLDELRLGTANPDDPAEGAEVLLGADMPGLIKAARRHLPDARRQEMSTLDQ
jgi:NAD(P)-dependent dehydrogenase (short-subunit alcohol dehydrogenase family)